MIGVEALVRLALARELIERVGIGERDAMQLAAALLGSERGELELGAVTVRCDRGAIERRVRERLPFALEVVVPRRRGRPPRNGPRRL